MFRSEEMSLNKVMFAKESMWETMNYLAGSKKIMMHLPNQSEAKNIKKTSLSEFGQKNAKRCE